MYIIKNVTKCYTYTSTIGCVLTCGCGGGGSGVAEARPLSFLSPFLLLEGDGGGTGLGVVTGGMYGSGSYFLPGGLGRTGLEHWDNHLYAMVFIYELSWWKMCYAVIFFN